MAKVLATVSFSLTPASPSPSPSPLFLFKLVTPKEIKKLYKKFNKLDTDKSGELEPEEFFDVPELSQNPLVKRVISIFDKNKDGKISFAEFLSGLGALSTTGSDEEKLKFAFKIYDLDEDGFISNGELFTVLKMMVGNNLNDVQLQQLVDRTIIKADEDFDGKISFAEFRKVVKDLDIGSKLTLNSIQEGDIDLSLQVIESSQRSERRQIQQNATQNNKLNKVEDAKTNGLQSLPNSLLDI
eukprot:TRINITY_DN1450_c0_g1_i8.p1 TRINITY_DN1450_c0_g1~~TRINITY_DN1450_c0_g1_i8.p1  ORF type:complete len:241 (+),score=63.10 TRINITY_DN1450_c0_g1_i8:195-917(+)